MCSCGGSTRCTLIETAIRLLSRLCVKWTLQTKMNRPDQDYRKPCSNDLNQSTVGMFLLLVINIPSYLASLSLFLKGVCSFFGTKQTRMDPETILLSLL